MNDSENFSDRCTPTSDCWPTESEWDLLDQLLGGGKLLRDVAPYLAVCRDPTKIEECGLRFANYVSENGYRETVPGNMMQPVWECDISKGECCGPEDQICHAGNIGSYAVRVEEPQDVAKAVAWACRHNVPLSVKTTGHDWHGKSTNKDTLNIWMYNMKKVTYHEAWSSDTCESTGSA